MADASAWDFRLGKERDAIPTTVDLLPHEVADVVESIAVDWGMHDPLTVPGAYDIIVPIGGLIRSNLARPSTVAELLSTGHLDAGAMVGLASARAASEGEAALARSRGVPAQTEQDALRFGLERAFDLDVAAWNEVTGSAQLRHNDSGKIPVYLAVAPHNTETGRRATTGEAFRWRPRSPRMGYALTTGGCLALQSPSPAIVSRAAAAR